MRRPALASAFVTPFIAAESIGAPAPCASMIVVFASAGPSNRKSTISLLPKRLYEVVDEQAHLHREMPGRRIDRIKRQWWRLVVVKQRPQLSSLQRRIGYKPRDQGNAAAGYRCVPKHLRIVCA